MSVIVYLENWEGKFKKNTFEAAQYAAKTAEMMGTEAIGVTFGDISDDASVIGKYGLSKVINLKGGDFTEFNNYKVAAALKDVASQNGGDTYIISGTFNGKAVAPVLAIQTEAGLITNVIDMPSSTSPLTVKRSVFSSKGLVSYSTDVANRIVVFIPNSVGVTEGEGSAEMSEGSVSVGDVPQSNVTDVDRVKGKIPLPEAERVVSGGRGMKGPENWGMIEELAEVLDAGTACSKPVSDMGWRPHTEHVGQTGIAINPDLYIAIGISGAIQHLAGVSNSKTIVAINNDAEAPFFKAADYGIVGDAFDVVPKLTEAIKKFKAEN
ncbi:electron transfer flavoprotein subunit alpha/FixB family protein [Owenweeksia hongkongensis]|uniref:Electron transfer flavoprotein, alpha subunit n=1 Tax=Owenweeksia hongkongensis (strain DSM 17368 / CIP 108786 / JCM 12287 / NRRL B-23963 / UST20020801) TaxID=926562 RepID=G8R1X4_OWEHD|nr:electron transfer flavoprotein subunit alpha/FixB family protein [Owenweeksia hongkongensis]AEV33924.1 electron transfer flavoprotein, alpha subunit [Owenweeksia hongkongensis DSM 17368]